MFDSDRWMAVLMSNWGISTFGLCLVCLGYMGLATFWSFFQLDVRGWYGLYPKHSSDMASMLLCSRYMAILSWPLCYQFMEFFGGGTAFNQFMGDVKFVPLLGKSFEKTYPLICCVLTVLHIINLWTGALNFMGLSVLHFEWKARTCTEEKLQIGKRLLEKERERRKSMVVAKTVELTRYAKHGSPRGARSPRQSVSSWTS